MQVGRLGTWWSGALVCLAAARLIACATGIDPTAGGTGGAGGTPANASTSAGLGGSTSAGFGSGGSASTTSGPFAGSATTTSGPFAGSATTTSGPFAGSATATTAAVTTSATASSTTASSTTGAGGASSASATSASSSTGAPPMGLSVEYKCTNCTSTMSQGLNFDLKIDNAGASTVSLSDLTLRYYFTDEGTGTPTFACDYAYVGNTPVTGSVTGTFTAATGTMTDHYLQISFAAAAGTLGPGIADEIQIRLYDSGYATLNQANDYSFDATKTAYATWDHVTLYQKGTLVWGTEP